VRGRKEAIVARLDASVTGLVERDQTSLKNAPGPEFSRSICDFTFSLEKRMTKKKFNLPLRNAQMKGCPDVEVDGD
jgi:hypothetical protein